jgi:hypothetical protein
VNEWKVIFATVLIFGAGVLTGGLLVNYVNHPHAKIICPSPVAAVNSTSLTNNQPKVASTNAPKPQARFPEILSKQFVDTLETNLQLTLGQRANIERIIADSQDEMRRTFQDARQSAREKIRKELTPSQVKEFDNLLKQQHADHVVKKTASLTNAPAINKSVSVVETNVP